ncbi:hypothetical protein J3454_02235 [Erythrobacter sp. NFXS35]|uniref:hypothetical protein n=1 Tax=Erythrobacter sp. NFXS35 TaxID=2818436 RepID=UPI0032DFE00F
MTLRIRMFTGPFARCLRYLQARFPSGAQGPLTGFISASMMLGLVSGILSSSGLSVADLSGAWFVVVIGLPVLGGTMALGFVLDRAIKKVVPEQLPTALDWFVFSSVSIAATAVGLSAFMTSVN